MTWAPRPLGSREKSPVPSVGGGILDASPVVAVLKEVSVADVGYLVVTVGGFVLLALILRGLEQL